MCVVNKSMQAKHSHTQMNPKVDRQTDKDNKENISKNNNSNEADGHVNDKRNSS